MKRLLIASCAVLALVAAAPKQLAQKKHKREEPATAALAQAKSAIQSKALAQAQAQSECGPDPCGCIRDECDRVNYDHQCDYLRDYDCLRNSIDILGGKIILVNLDDRYQVEQLEREGIFLEVGDVLLFAGRGNYDAGEQEWDLCDDCDDFPDCDILEEHDDYEFALESDHLDGYYLDYFFYEGVGFGQTRIDFCFNFGDLEVLHNSFDVYVGLRPTLMAVTSPRHSCDWCGQSDRWSS